MERSDYRWNLEVHFPADGSYDAVRSLVDALDTALVSAVERTLSQTGAESVTVEIGCGATSEIDRRITFRKGYQITEVPATVDTTSYASTREAIEQLRSLRALAKPEVSPSLVVVREPDGSLRMGQQAPDGCEFATQAAAEEALCSFDDPTGYAVIPYLEITTERELNEEDS